MASSNNVDSNAGTVSWRGIYWLTFIIVGQMALIGLSFNANTPVLAWANKVLNCPALDRQITFRFHSMYVCRIDTLEDGTEIDNCDTYDDAIDDAENANNEELEDFLKDAQAEFGTGQGIAIGAYALCALQLMLMYAAAYLITRGKLAATERKIWLLKCIMGAMAVIVALFAVLSGFTGGESLEDERPFNGTCTSATVFPGFAVCAGCIAGTMGLAEAPLLFDFWWMLPNENNRSKTAADVESKA